MTRKLAPPEISDQGEGPAVILIHPLGADLRYWGELSLALEGYRLIAYNLPGHGGRPEVPGGYRIDELAEDLGAVMDGIDLTSAVIVGVSIGGLVVQAFAAEHPERVDHAFMVDTVSVYPEDFAANLAARADLVLAQGLAAVIESTLATWFTSDFLQRRPDIVGLVGAMLQSASPEGYAQACRALIDADLRSVAEHISCPSTIVCGSDDLPAFTEGSEWLNEAITGSRLRWLDGGRHAAALECSEDFAALLIDELAR